MKPIATKDVLPALRFFKARDYDKAQQMFRERALFATTNNHPPQVEIIGKHQVCFARANQAPPKALQSMALRLRDNIHSGIVVLSASDGDKALVAVAVTLDLTAQVRADNLVQVIASTMEGQGQGQTDFGQCEGNSALLDQGLDQGRKLIHALVKPV